MSTFYTTDSIDKFANDCDDENMVHENRIMSFVIRRLRHLIKGPKLLSLGYNGDDWPAVASEMGIHVDVVEGSETHVKAGQKRFKGNSSVSIVHCLFEDYTPSYDYNTVVAGSVIEYYEDPTEFLQLIQSWLIPDGTLILTTPNRKSLHRKIGAHLGIEENTNQMNSRAIVEGQRKMYDRLDLMNVLRNSKLSVQSVHGMFLKPLSNNQMKDFSDELLQAFLKVGDDFGEMAKVLVALCLKTKF